METEPSDFVTTEGAEVGALAAADPRAAQLSAQYNISSPQ